MDFIICTPEVNRYGYRILPNGVLLDNFLKNPVALWVHDNHSYPVGKWENLRLLNGNLVASITEFAETEEGELVKKLVEGGFLNATSMGHNPIEWSEELSLLLPGQTRPTVTKSELLEISFVPVPGNPGAVRLTLSGGKEDVDAILPLLNQQSDTNMKEVIKLLGLAEGATEQDVLAVVKNMQDTIARNNDAAIETLLQLGKSKGLVTTDNEKVYRKLAAESFADIEYLFKNTPELKKETEPASVVDILKAAKLASKTTEDGDDRTSWTFDDWSKKDPRGLLAMKKSDPAKYSALAASKAQNVHLI